MSHVVASLAVSDSVGVLPFKYGCLPRIKRSRNEYSSNGQIRRIQTPLFWRKTPNGFAIAIPGTSSPKNGMKIEYGKGRYLDNIFVERLWRSVKYEEVYLKAYRNGSEARRGIDAYLDLYNRERPHQSLGYRTPAQVFAEGRPLRCLPDRAPTLSSRESSVRLSSGSLP